MFVSPPLWSLRVLNSSGKSTLLQAIGALRQSYDPNGRTDGLSLSGQLVQLGQYGRPINRGRRRGRGRNHDRGKRRQSSVGARRGDAMPISCNLAKRLPPHQTSSHHLTSKTAGPPRLIPQTLYPQAPQRARDAGFLGSRGEYTADFLGMAAKRPVARARTFPRTGLGINEDLLNKAPAT